MSSTMTPTSFADAVLEQLGVDPSTVPNSVQSIVDWARAEGGAGPQWGIPNNTDNYNPLNTTQPEAGSVGTNGPGVQSYTSWEQGIAATVQTLENGHYGNIVADLKGNAAETQTAADVGASPWGTGDFATGGTPQAQGANGSGASTTGLDLNPLNGFGIPGEIWGGVSAAGGGGIASGILGVVDVVTKPLKKYLEDSFLVIFGVIFLLVGLFILSKGSSGAAGQAVQGVLPAGPGQSEGEKSGGAEADAGEAAEVAA